MVVVAVVSRGGTYVGVGSIGRGGEGTIDLIISECFFVTRCVIENDVVDAMKRRNIGVGNTLRACDDAMARYIRSTVLFVLVATMTSDACCDGGAWPLRWWRDEILGFKLYQ